MKVKILSRNPHDFIRETKRDIHRVPRNFDASLHPLQAEREYVQGLNAVKLERVFAKPFLGSLDGHRDGVNTLTKHPTSLSLALSGSYDGEIRAWNLASRKCTWSVQAHDRYVRGMAFNPSGEHFYSCGEDKMIKRWQLNEMGEGNDEPAATIVGKRIYLGITHHQTDPTFATCGDVVELWDEGRTSALRSFQWGTDSVQCIKFNPIETHLLGACAADRSIILYDVRESLPMRKVVLKLRSNCLAWNPQEAFYFCVANEDYNLYSFDIRKLTSPINVHRDHVSAVLSVDYAPTGKEFVSGGYDKSIRIFPVNKGHSREIYHTKRMQIVQQVCWSSDNKYVLSASDEMNIRVWKANASEKLGVLRPREKEALAVGEKLKEKFQHHPEIKRIKRHRHIPRQIYNRTREHRAIRNAQKRREANRRAHSKRGRVPFVSERQKHVVGTVE